MVWKLCREWELFEFAIHTEGSVDTRILVMSREEVVDISRHSKEAGFTDIALEGIALS